MTIFGEISLFLGSIFSSIFSFPYKVTFSSPLSDLTYFYFCYDLIFKQNTHVSAFCSSKVKLVRESLLLLK